MTCIAAMQKRIDELERYLGIASNEAFDLWAARVAKRLGLTYKCARMLCALAEAGGYLPHARLDGKIWGERAFKQDKQRQRTTYVYKIRQWLVSKTKLPRDALRLVYGEGYQIHTLLSHIVMQDKDQ